MVIDVQIMDLRKITKWKEVQGGENNVYAYPNGTVSIIFNENIYRTFSIKIVLKFFKSISIDFQIYLIKDWTLEYVESI